MGRLPEPHPLDYDWRYSQASVQAFAELLPVSQGVLAVGAPSLARHLERAGREVRLVDRQPFQCVDNHRVADIDAPTPLEKGFQTAVVDPPWYPADVRTWTAWAGNCVGRDGSLFVTVWPSGTRPGDRDEYEQLLTWMAAWSEVSEHGLKPTYEVPSFEVAASLSASGGGLSMSPRIGRLLHLKVSAPCAVPASRPKEVLWHRFVFNEYQIAVRTAREGNAQPHFERLPNVEGWNWPFVSRRAPGRDLIDVWSSQNEIAISATTSALVDALRALATLNNERSFERTLSNFPQLLEWRLPRPPYWRTFEWQHQQ